MAEEKKKFDFVAPFKGIPDVVKGLPKNLVRMWKDPVTTPDQLLERRAEVWSALYLFIISAIVLNTLQAIPAVGMVFGIIAMVPTLLIIPAVLQLFMLKKIAKRFAALTCDSCNSLLDIDTQEQYKEYVFYKILSHEMEVKVEETLNKEKHLYSVSADAIAKAELEVSFKCPQCGNIKTFIYKIQPFKGYMIESDVHPLNLSQVKSALSEAIIKVKAAYVTNPASLPYTVHSVHHPNYENRADPQLARGTMMDELLIKYHRDIEEMVEGYFIHNELTGSVE